MAVSDKRVLWPLSAETGLRVVVFPRPPNQDFVVGRFFRLNEPSSHGVRIILTDAPAKSALTKRSGSKYSGVRARLCTKTNTQKTVPNIPSKGCALCCQSGCRLASNKVAVKNSTQARRPTAGSMCCTIDGRPSWIL